MAVPKDTLWTRDPHTEAKHRLLSKYLAAWFPILSRHYRDEGITYVDAFAGPGEYLNSDESSPVIAVKNACRSDVVGNGAPLRLIFIEERADRWQHLDKVLRSISPTATRPPLLDLRPVHGSCETHMMNALDDAGAWVGPIFANMDGWGVDTPLELVRRIGGQRSSEVLVTLQDQWFTRFATLEEQTAGDLVFGDADWREVSNVPTADKRSFLISEYTRRLREVGFPFTLTFDLLDEGGHALCLIYGTSSDRGVEKMKEALWSVDPVAGARFRDPKDPNQVSMNFGEAVNLKPLEDEFVVELRRSGGQLDLESLAEFALLETVYLKTHARPAVERLLESTVVERIANGRSHRERVFRLTNDGRAAPSQASLFD